MILPCRVRKTGAVKDISPASARRGWAAEKRSAPPANCVWAETDHELVHRPLTASSSSLTLAASTEPESVQLPRSFEPSRLIADILVWSSPPKRLCSDPPSAV